METLWLLVIRLEAKVAQPIEEMTGVGHAGVLRTSAPPGTDPLKGSLSRQAVFLSVASAMFCRGKEISSHSAVFLSTAFQTRGST